MKPEDFEPNGKYMVGRVVQAKAVTYEGARTEPPSRYTQSDLIDDMLAAHKFASNERDRALLRQIDGLGTSRTRESTITNLIDRGFLIAAKAKGSKTRTELKPTEAAMTIIANLPRMLVDPATTAKWEMAFQMIEQGKAQPSDVTKYLGAMLQELVTEAKGRGSIPIASGKAGTSSGNQFSKGVPASGGPSRSAGASR